MRTKTYGRPWKRMVPARRIRDVQCGVPAVFVTTVVEISGSFIIVIRHAEQQVTG